jgi:hypothetical protein
MSGAPMRKQPDWREIGAALIATLIFTVAAVLLIWLTTYLAEGFIAATSVEMRPR